MMVKHTPIGENSIANTLVLVSFSLKNIDAKNYNENYKFDSYI